MVIKFLFLLNSNCENQLKCDKINGKNYGKTHNVTKPKFLEQILLGQKTYVNKFQVVRNTQTWKNTQTVTKLN